LAANSAERFTNATPAVDKQHRTAGVGGKAYAEDEVDGLQIST
jgi:hypothetical protein